MKQKTFLDLLLDVIMKYHYGIDKPKMELPNFTTNKMEFTRYNRRKRKSTFNLMLEFEILCFDYGGWFLYDKNLMCLFGQMNIDKIIFVINHEYMHKLLDEFLGRIVSIKYDRLETRDKKLLK